MIFLILVAITLQTPQTNNSEWASLILHSAKAQKYVLKAKATKLPASTNSPQSAKGQDKGADVHNPSAGVQPELGSASLNQLIQPYNPEDGKMKEAWWKEGQRLRARARELVKSGDRPEALDFLRKMYTSHPSGDIGAFIVDLDLELGQNKNAYRDLMDCAQYADLTALPRLSLVAALNGQVVPGQAEFLRNFLLHGSMFDESGERLPKGDTPQEVVALSYLALGGAVSTTDYEAAVFYDQQAVHLDPDDPMSLMSLSWAYSEAGRLLDAEQTARKALTEIHSAKMRSYQTMIVAEFTNIVKKFGNVGKPDFELK
jgi:tetratricopeptide (TPR) repeat protein